MGARETGGIHMKARGSIFTSIHFPHVALS